MRTAKQVNQIQQQYNKDISKNKLGFLVTVNDFKDLSSFKTSKSQSKFKKVMSPKNEIFFNPIQQIESYQQSPQELYQLKLNNLQQSQNSEQKESIGSNMYTHYHSLQKLKILDLKTTSKQELFKNHSIVSTGLSSSKSNFAFSSKKQLTEGNMNARQETSQSKYNLMSENKMVQEVNYHLKTEAEEKLKNTINAINYKNKVTKKQQSKTLGYITNLYKDCFLKHIDQEKHCNLFKNYKNDSNQLLKKAKIEKLNQQSVNSQLMNKAYINTDSSNQNPIISKNLIYQQFISQINQGYELTNQDQWYNKINQYFSLKDLKINEDFPNKTITKFPKKFGQLQQDSTANQQTLSSLVSIDEQVQKKKKKENSGIDIYQYENQPYYNSIVNLNLQKPGEYGQHQSRKLNKRSNTYKQLKSYNIITEKSGVTNIGYNFYKEYLLDSGKKIPWYISCTEEEKKQRLNQRAQAPQQKQNSFVSVIYQAINKAKAKQ